MSNLKRTAHSRALTELIEVITIASLLALVADTMWCFYEIHKYGLSWQLLTIVTALTVASVAVALALYKYHMRQVKEYLHGKFLDWQLRRAHCERYKRKHKLH